MKFFVKSIDDGRVHAMSFDHNKAGPVENASQVSRNTVRYVRKPACRLAIGSEVFRYHNEFHTALKLHLLRINGQDQGIKPYVLFRYALRYRGRNDLRGKSPVR